MTQNRSHAVMAQRQGELLAQEHEDFPGQAKLDDFPTPPWAVRALMQKLTRFGLAQRDHDCWEPTANRGYMVRALQEYFGRVSGSDVHDYGGGFGKVDFVMDGCAFIGTKPDWIIANPPFVLADVFCRTAIERANAGVAMLVRTTFLDGIGRYHDLWSKQRPNLVLQYAERVPMVRGRVDPDASTATAYCWLIWSIVDPTKATILDWIAPCRKELERVDDYPTVTA